MLSPSLPSVFLTAVLVTFLAEILCAIRAASLTSLYGHPWVIFAGTIVGTILTMLIGTLAGQALHEHIPPIVIRLISGSSFIILGVLMMLGKIK